MNGSTVNSGVVGFNPEQVRKLLGLIARAYELETSNMDGLFYCFPNAMEGIDLGDLTGKASAGWFSPEAKRFCEDVLTPAEMTAFKKVYVTYVDVYDSVIAAAKKWDATTGNANSYPEWPFYNHRHSGYGDTITVPDSKNGNVGIDPKIIDHVKTIYVKCRNALVGSFDTIFNQIKQEGAFLGADQHAQLLAKINSAHSLTLEKSDEVYAIALREMNAAVAKYQAIARQIAGSFSGSPSAGVAGSTSNSFNTTN